MAARNRLFRPEVERLEMRWTPAVTAYQMGTTLIIRGDAADNSILVTDHGDGAVTASITGATGSDSISAENVVRINIYGNGGDDSIHYFLMNSLRIRRELNVYLGAGNDTANLNLNAGVRGGDFHAVVAGWTGDDRVGVDFGTIDNAHVHFRAHLHAGDDDATIRFNHSIDKSTVSARVEGAGGNDKLSMDVGNVFDSRVDLTALMHHGDDALAAQFFGHLFGASSVSMMSWDGYGNDVTSYFANGVNIDEQSTLSLRTRSFSGIDRVDADWSGELDGRLHVSLVGGWGSDEITANLAAFSASSGDLFAAVIGWWQPDVLTLNIFERAQLRSLIAYVDGGRFTSDTIHSTGNVRTFNG